MATESGNYTPEVIARRQAIANELRKNGNRPIRHWMEGVANLGNEAGAAALDWRTQQQEKEGQAKIAELLLGINGGAGQPPLGGPLANAAPMPSGPQGANVASKIYSPDEPSPLDPPSGKDRDLAIRTMLSEAGNQGPVGLQAVGNVIRNRAVSGNQGGDTPAGVVTARNQFEPWNTPGGRAKMASYDPNGPQYENASAALDKAYTGDDPTNGAQNFFAPKAQAALGRPVPAWGAQGGQDIGDHRFIGGKPLDPAASPAMAFNGQPQTATDASMPGGAPSPAGQPPATPTPAASAQQVAQALMPGQDAPQAPAPNPLAAKVAEMLRDPNPYVRQMGQNYAQQMMQKQFAPKDAEFGVIGADRLGNPIRGWIDKSNRTLAPATPSGAPAQNQANQGDLPTGEDFLKTIPKAEADQVKAMVEGRLQPPGSFALKSPYWQGMLQNAAQYEPGFDMTKWGQRQATAKDFASGQAAKNVTSLNTVIGHLGDLSEKADALKNWDTPIINKIGNWRAQATGQPEVNNFMLARNAVADEMAKVFRSSGMSDHEIQQWKDTLNESMSPAQLKGSVKTAINLMDSRLSALTEQRNRGMSTQAQPSELLSEKSRAQLDKIKKWSEGTPEKKTESAPSGGGPDKAALEAEMKRRGLL